MNTLSMQVELHKAYVISLVRELFSVNKDIYFETPQHQQNIIDSYNRFYEGKNSNILTDFLVVESIIHRLLLEAYRLEYQEAMIDEESF